MSGLRNLVLCALLLLAISGATSDEISSRIKREPVNSSNVASIGYSRHLHALEIEFSRGAIYRFLHVPRAVFSALMLSDSKGHFIAQYIRGKYEFVKVRASNIKTIQQDRLSR